LGVQDFSFDVPKTKSAQDVLKHIGIFGKKTLLVLPQKDEHIVKSFRNLPRVKYLHADYLNPVDLMSYHTVLFFESALQHLTKK